MTAMSNLHSAKTLNVHYPLLIGTRAIWTRLVRNRRVPTPSSNP